MCDDEKQIKNKRIRHTNNKESEFCFSQTSEVFHSLSRVLSCEILEKPKSNPKSFERFVNLQWENKDFYFDCVSFVSSWGTQRNENAHEIEWIELESIPSGRKFSYNVKTHESHWLESPLKVLAQTPPLVPTAISPSRVLCNCENDFNKFFYFNLDTMQSEEETPEEERVRLLTDESELDLSSPTTAPTMSAILISDILFSHEFLDAVQIVLNRTAEHCVDFPSLEEIEQSFYSPSSDWSTLVFVHQCVMSPPNDWKRTHSKKEVKAWLRHFYSMCKEEVEVPFRLFANDPRPMYSELPPLTRVRLFQHLVGFPSQSFIKGKEFFEPCFVYYPKLAPWRFYRQEGERLLRLSFTRDELVTTLETLVLTLTSAEEWANALLRSIAKGKRVASPKRQSLLNSSPLGKRLMYDTSPDESVAELAFFACEKCSHTLVSSVHSVCSSCGFNSSNSSSVVLPAGSAESALSATRPTQEEESFKTKVSPSIIVPPPRSSTRRVVVFPITQLPFSEE